MCTVIGEESCCILGMLDAARDPVRVRMLNKSVSLTASKHKKLTAMLLSGSAGLR